MEKKPFLRIDRSKIRKHWEKTDSEVEEYIESLKSWIKTKDFIEMPTNQMIEFFLTNCKYNLDKTKINITTYYSIRKFVPEVYEYSNPKLPEIKEAWKMGAYLPLPNPLEDLYRVILINLNSEVNFDIRKYLANFMNVYEVRVCEDLVLGEICVMDYKQLKWSHVFQFSPFLVRKMIHLMENLAKNRVKGIHIIQPPAHVSVLINIGKKFLKQKMADRIQVHKCWESLYDFVPQELLPSDYGGKEKSINELTKIWKNKVEEYQSRFDMWDRLFHEN